MSRVPRDLVARLDYFQREVENLFHRLFGAEIGTDFEQENSVPPMDLIETEEEMILRADLPGVQRDGIELHAAPNYLMLRGTRPTQELRCDALRVERCFSPFQRLISLPSTADTGRVTAKLSKGVLEVRVPKMSDRRKGQRRVPIL